MPKTTAQPECTHAHIEQVIPLRGPHIEEFGFCRSTARAYTRCVQCHARITKKKAKNNA